VPESQHMSSTVPVALLYQGDDLGGHLRNALRDLGAAVVYETLATNLDRGALEGSGARIVVFNLDSQSDAQLDHVYDVLDEGDYEVVFNDADVSGHLSGSDQARWARHLAAKILHKPEIAVPARPAWAESVPTPAQKKVAAAAPSIPPATAASVTAAVMPPPVAVANDATVADLSAGLAPVEAATEIPTLEMPVLEVFSAAELHSSAKATVGETPTLEVPVLEVFSAAEMYPPAEGAAAAAAEQDFSAALEDFARQVPSHTYATSPANDFAGEIDALFGDSRTAQPAAPTHTPVPDAPAAALDIESLFGGMSLPDSAVGDRAAFDQFASVADAIPEAEDRSFKPGRLPTLEAVEAPPTTPLLPPDWSLEPFNEDAQPAPVPSGKASFGLDLMSASEFLATEDEGANAITQLPVADALSLELMPLEDAVAPSAFSAAAQAATSAQQPESAQPLKVGTGVELRRVFVLGASIGGPEAVREFLGALPPRFPALFVLVQHMGDEFLELMSAQLARAVSLTVRTPTHGERFGHGEIVIVTTKQRLQIDTEGVATLSSLPERSAYSPSIDLVLRDVADQFGERAGAIIFSGMAQDAIAGSSYLKSKGGVVWTQDPNTCTISTMVDAVTQTGAVSFSGSPQALAAKMIADYGAD